MTPPAVSVARLERPFTFTRHACDDGPAFMEGWRMVFFGGLGGAGKHLLQETPKNGASGATWRFNSAQIWGSVLLQNWEGRMVSRMVLLHSQL